jgi:hypothetical protein
VRESAFYSNKVAALEQLWRALEERDIFPTSSLTVVSPEVADEKRDESPCDVAKGDDSMGEAEGFLLQEFRSSGAPLQLELNEQLHAAPKITEMVSDTRLGAALAYSVAEQLKRSRQDGFFTRSEIAEVALAFLRSKRQMGRKELADKITNALELPEHHDKRVEDAFEILERAGKISISLGANSISLIAPRT